MRSVKSLLAAGAATLISSMAFAADMPIAAPPPMYAPPAPAADFGGWYLRGDIGFSNQKVKQLNPSFVDPGISIASTQGLGFDTAGIFGLGAGYRFNSWFRADVTGEYRGNANLHGLQIINFNGAPAFTDEYHGSKSEWLMLANAYVDLGTWWCITPYIGGGVGGAFQRITGLTDVGHNADGTGGFGLTSGDSGAWGLAWNVQAGLTYNVTRNFKVDFNWRFLELGSPQSAVVFCQNTPACPGAFFTLRDLSSQDFRIGLRWMLTPEPPPPVFPAVVSKG